MTFFVDFQSVSVWKRLATHLTLHVPLACVEFLYMEHQVCHTATGGRTQLTLVIRFVPGVDSSVSLQAVTLSEPDVTYITLVWFPHCGY